MVILYRQQLCSHSSRHGCNYVLIVYYPEGVAVQPLEQLRKRRITWCTYIHRVQDASVCATKEDTVSHHQAY